MIDIFKWMDYIKQTSHSYARKYQNIQADDISQELSIWLFERANDPRLNGVQNADGYIATALQNVAKNYCRRELSTFSHYSGKYIYRVHDVRKLLDGLFSQNPVKAEDDDELYGHTTNIDLKYCLEQLTEKQQDIIRKAYTTPIQLSASERVNLQRAIERLTVVLNRSGANV
jgi:DNA-directed RNA polymerase specialized sigma24 family protein